MINFCVTEAHTGAVRHYLKGWSSEHLSARIGLITYERISMDSSLPAGTYVFSDFDRLSPAQIAVADVVAHAAQTAGFQVLNVPSRVLRRCDLAKALHECGVNGYRAYRVGETPRRFPVFVRPEGKSKDVPYKLLRSEHELNAHIEELVAQGVSAETLLVVEFFDAADANGVYRNYSIQRIGDIYFPRRLFFSREWNIKMSAEPWSPELQKEEQFFDTRLAYEHMPAIQKVFKLAKIEYGRVDYAIVDGKIQVWRIDTNPLLMPKRARANPNRMERMLQTANAISDAFNVIDNTRPGLLVPEPLLGPDGQPNRAIFENKDTATFLSRRP